MELMKKVLYGADSMAGVVHVYVYVTRSKGKQCGVLFRNVIYKNTTLAFIL